MGNASVMCVAVTLVLTACANVGTLKTPAVPAAGAYGRGSSDANQPTMTFAPTPALEKRVRDEEDQWWKLFGDERLNRLVATVIQRNTDLASAGLRLERARLAAGLAFDSTAPHLDVSLGSGYSKRLSSNSAGARSYSTSGSISYELDLWGKLRAQTSVAEWEVSATEQDLQSTRLLLVGTTCNLYWSLAALNQRVETGEASLEYAERTLKFVQTQFDAGAVGKLELREAEQSLRIQQTTQSQSILQRIETRNSLTVLLDGRPWPDDDEPRNLDGVVSPDVAAGLPAELLGRRPDLRSAELRLREELATGEITRVSYYPSIGLSASAGGSSQALTDLLANPVGSLGAGLALPFLHWNAMTLHNRMAEVGSKIATNDFRAKLYIAFTEVDDALSAKAELGKQLRSSEESFDAAVEVERIYEVRYRAGATSLRTWLDAQESRRSAELALTQARLSQLKNDASLFQALGASG